MALDSLPAYLPHLESGKVRVLAVASAQRSPLLPELPTLREAGVAGVEADAWVGLIAPAATPAAILDKIHKEVVAVLREPEVAARLAPQLMVPIGNTPDAFRAILKEEHDRWAPIIAAGGIKVE